MNRLKNGYTDTFRDAANKEAFELLAREAWDTEHSAMVNSGVPLVLDVMNLTANIHNKGEILRLREKLTESDRKLEELQEQLKRLEQL